MTQTKAHFDRAADDEGLRLELRCTAHGCPSPWTTTVNGKLCSAHAWADPKRWATITQWLLDREADLAFAADRQQPARPVRVTPRDVAAVGAALARSMRSVGPRDWAQRLREREQAGGRLTDAQKAMWRAALGWREAEAQPELDGIDPAPASDGVDVDYVPDLAEEHEPW